MKKEDIHIEDIRRILQGAVPGEFYIELVIRAVFVYLMIAFGMKFMGKRISADLSRSELASIASLAAATGLVIMAPERGLLPPVIVLAVMIGIKAILDRGNYRNAHMERITEGSYSILIKNGVLQTEVMRKIRLSREQVFAQLRESGLIHIGNIERMYIEANGSFAIINAREKRPGLPVLPNEDTAFLAELPRDENTLICMECGNEKRIAEEPCGNCHATGALHPVRDE